MNDSIRKKKSAIAQIRVLKPTLRWGQPGGVEIASGTSWLTISRGPDTILRLSGAAELRLVNNLINAAYTQGDQQPVSGRAKDLSNQDDNRYISKRTVRGVQLKLDFESTDDPLSLFVGNEQILLRAWSIHDIGAWLALLAGRKLELISLGNSHEITVDRGEQKLQITFYPEFEKERAVAITIGAARARELQALLLRGAAAAQIKPESIAFSRSEIRLTDGPHPELMVTVAGREICNYLPKLELAYFAANIDLALKQLI